MPTLIFSRRNAAPLLLALSLLPAGLAPADARAQTVCDLTAAKADFETGLFDHVIAMLEPCIEKGFAPAEQEDAWALLAKTWLALDEVDKADAAISRLLAQNPGFRPAFDDPLPFQRRVGQLRDQRPAVMVTSVSKTPESLRLAPATVAVVTAEEIARRAAAGETLACAALDRYEARMARALASIVNVIDPEVIVLGGGLSNIDRLYRNVPTLWAPHIFSDRATTRLVRAMHGDSSGVRGAAWLWE